MMIPFLIFLVSAGASVGTVPQEPANICPSSGTPIHVRVHGIRNAQGTVKAKLYGPNPEEFLVKGKKIDTQREPAQKGSMTLCVAAPEIGQYAVVVHHDENGNKKLDRNWIGFPTEGFGFSNNPELFLGPPSHDEVAFQVVDGQTTIDINLQY